jgi:hypothetical protein
MSHPLFSKPGRKPDFETHSAWDPRTGKRLGPSVCPHTSGGGIHCGKGYGHEGPHEEFKRQVPR